MSDATMTVDGLGNARGADESTRRVRFRGSGFEVRRYTTASWISFAAIIVVWELAGRLGGISSLVLPSPTEIVTAAAGLIRSGELFRHIAASLFRLAIGWSLGTVFGIAIGLLIGIWSMARSIGVPLVAAIFPIPKIALLPLMILWLGIGETSKVVTIALGVFFPTVIATCAGVDDVPRNLIRMAQSFGLGLPAIIRTIILPGALPGMLAGARISTSIGILLLVSAEMIGADDGIGAFVLTAGNLMQTDKLLVGVVVLSILGLAASMLLGRLERRLLRWR
jgi:ABC-type nitrate/sulfonate/bicarbonate transport system permease component